MNTKLSRLLSSMSLLAAFGPGICAPTTKPHVGGSPSGIGSPAAGEFHVTGDIQTLPFTMVHEFPFVAAEVNGTKGKLMFDTGTQDALSLNDHLLTKLGPGTAVGSGFVGSGQSYTVTLRPKVDQVSIGPLGGSLSFADVPNIRSQDLSFLEPITPDCLGFIGYGFFDGSLMKLDYGGSVLTFYKATAARRASRDFLKGETVLAVLPFETRRLPNHPLIHLKIGAEDFLGAFDTGQIGMVQMSAATQQALTDQHLLTPLSTQQPTNGPKGHGAPVCRIEGLRLTDTLTASVSGVPVFNQPSPAAVPMGTPEANIISLGYAFLSQYKTVWDYPDKKIYLLKK